MNQNSSFKSGLPWMLAGAALALLAVVLLRPAPGLQAQTPVTPAQNGTYQLAAWSSTDQQGNAYCGFFIFDTRSGQIIDCEYNTVPIIVNKYSK
jgi:hypothetical protein